MAKRLATWVILLCAFCGIADSAYLYTSERTGTPLICDVGSLTGCNAVAQSPYSYLFHIPLSAYGLAFYGLIFVIASLELFLFHHLTRRALQMISGFGFVASLIFVGLQVFAIKQICIYCMLSAFLTVLIFVAAGFLGPIGFRRMRESHISVSPPPAPPPHFSMPPSA